MRRIYLEKLGALLHWRGRTLALICLAVFLAIRATNPAPLEALRMALFDALHVFKPRAWQELPVIIVDIDEDSLARYGQWPWPRNLVAQLVDSVAATQPLAIGFDILFPEPDRLSPHLLLQNLPDIHPDFRQHIASMESHDTRLSRSLAAAPTVLGLGALVDKPPSQNLRPVTQGGVVHHGGPSHELMPQFEAAVQSLPELDNAATSRAALNVTPESDGIIRRVPLVVAIDGTVTPTLTIEMLRVATGAPHFAIHRDNRRITGISVADTFIPTDPDGRIWVNFSQPRGERYVSAADILDGKAAALKRIQGKLVLLGSTALGLVDAKATPVASRLNGIEVHAMLLESLITGDLLSRPPFADMLELGLILISGLVLILLIPFLKPKWAFLPLGLLIALLAGSAWAAHHFFALRVDTTFAGLSDISVFAVLLGATLVEIERTRRLLAADLEAERAAAARMEGELEAARTIQLGILPSDFPAFPEHREFDLHAKLEPAKAVGGDLYDFAMLDDDHLFFIVGDVSGKGIPASLFMAITKALYKSSAMRRKVAIEEIMTEANAEISKENPAMLFVTALAGIMNIRNGSIEFCNAGHDAPILLAPGQAPKPIETDGGPPLCVLDDFEYPRDSYQLNPGEAIVLYTDGVTEAMNPQDELYSLDRMTRNLATVSDDGDCAAIVNSLYEDVEKFANGADPSDDITILVLRFLGSRA